MIKLKLFMLVIFKFRLFEFVHIINAVNNILLIGNNIIFNIFSEDNNNFMAKKVI